MQAGRDGNAGVKPVPQGMEYVMPRQVMKQQMNNSREIIRERAAGYEKKHDENDKVLAAVACEEFMLRKTLSRRADLLSGPEMKPLLEELTITCNRLRKALEGVGVEIADLTGMEIATVAEGGYMVLEWRTGPCEAERVIETHEPLVRRGGRIIGVAKVTCCTNSLPSSAEPD